GGDELNLMRPGVNYGWPAITYGIDYSGATISPYTSLPGMEQPLTYWDPSIAPSGMTLYQGELFPEWQGDLFLTSLRFKNVYRVDMQDGTPGDQQTLFSDIKERLRDIRKAPDGSLYILAEGENGTIWQVLRK
ncbi:MAG: PQQ-dependent sugar dehydrogenase, partial [Pseudomonadota bacterium]|nr:PQQ-dependent sugar dehydrogenase [Pseudomonadota bacterium]